MVFEIYGREVEPGDRLYIRMKVAKLLDGGELSIPLHAVVGEEEGPVLGLVAGNHGTEYYHNRVVRRAIEEAVPSEMRGTLLAIPVANPRAFASMTRLTPWPPEETADFSNLNRVFPGKRVVPLFGSMEPTDVSLTMKIAATITDQFVSKCNCILDFHGHSRGGALKKMLYQRSSEESQVLSRIFGLGIIHDPVTSGGDQWSGPFMPLTAYAGKIGIPAITPEIGGGGHGEAFEGACEEIALRGIRNVMVHLGMMDGEIVVPEKQFYFRRAPHIRASQGGYLVSNMEAEDVGVGRPTREVSKGEVLGTLYDPYTLEEVEQLKAPADGLLYMCQVSGLVEAQGGGIAVADFEDSKWIE